MMWSASSWGWFVGILLVIFCMMMMGRMMMGRMMMGRGHGSHTRASHGGRPGEAEQILAERLARGEIDIEEYERRLAVLQRATKLDRG